MKSTEMFSEEFISDNFYFPDDDLVFFNHGTYGICPKPVLEEKFNILRKFEENPVFEFATTMFDGCLKSTKLLAERIGVDYQNLAIISNVTNGFWSILQSIAVNPGEEILLTNFTYEAVKMEVEEILIPKGLVIRTLVLEPPFQSKEAIVNIYKRFVSDYPKIKYAIIDHIPSALPLVQPVREIVAALRPLGVFVMIDGAHAPGQLRGLNVEAIDADVYVGNLHKWFFLPRGTGFLALRDGLAIDVRPPVVSFLHKRELYLRFVFLGTNDVSNVLCVKRAFDFFDITLGGFDIIDPVIVATLAKGVSYLETQWKVRSLTFPEMAPFIRLIPLPDGFYKHKGHITRAIQSPFQLDYYSVTLKKYKFVATIVTVSERLYFRLCCHIYVTFGKFVKFSDRVQQWLDDLDNDGSIDY